MTARIERLRVFPVKGLGGNEVDAAEVIEGGTLAHDREFALFDAGGEVLNGKRTDRVHGIAVDFDPRTSTLWVTPPDGDEHEFDLPRDVERAERWFGAYFGKELRLRRDTSLGYVDRRELGPSVISTATLRTVASWFDGMDVASARRRMRANVEVSGVPAFWEDRFVGEGAPAILAGDVRLEGVTPCGRCIVPQRDPDTGDRTPAFRETFLRKRRETFPDWADPYAFDHDYTLMIVTRVPATDRGKTLRRGDPVEVTS